MWREFFHFSKLERRGIILLMLLIIVLGVIGNSPRFFHRDDTNDYSMEEAKVTYEAFLNGIAEVEKRENNKQKVSYPKKNYQSLPSPRTANIRKDSVRLLAGHIAKDTYPRTFKYPAGSVLDINEADTTELKKIPGIGSATAYRISNYRKALGGFYDITQLADIHLDVDKFDDWFMVSDEPPITKLNLNKVGLERLRNHPYINFYQAKAIFELRKKRGNLSGLRQLALLDEFTDADFERLKHYVCF